MTDLEAANRALMALGVETISSLSADTKPARVMNSLLANTKLLVMSEFPWTFSLRLSTYTSANTSTVFSARYACSVAVPSGALTVLNVYDGTTGRAVAFRVIGKTIYTNATSGTIEYTTNVTDLSQWPQQLAECFVMRLATDAAAALTGSGQVAAAMLERYMLLLQDAARTTAAEVREVLDFPTDYVDARV